MNQRFSCVSLSSVKRLSNECHDSNYCQMSPALYVRAGDMTVNAVDTKEGA